MLKRRSIVTEYKNLWEIFLYIFTQMCTGISVVEPNCLYIIIKICSIIYLEILFCVVRTLRGCVFSAHPGKRFRDKGQYSDMDQSEPRWSPPLSSWSDTHPRFQRWPFNTSWKHQSCWSDRILCAEDTGEEPTDITVWGTFHYIVHSCIGQ